MPRYTPEHGSVLERVESALAASPGLYLAGNSLFGVGIPAAIAAGERAAASAAVFASPRPKDERA